MEKEHKTGVKMHVSTDLKIVSKQHFNDNFERLTVLYGMLWRTIWSEHVVPLQKHQQF